MEDTKIRICPNCHVALMYQHPESREYEKCVLCGFCQKKPSELKTVEQPKDTP